MLREWHDDQIVAIGWPWHGRVITFGDVSTLELAGGESMSLPRFNAAARVTWAFDMGRPDIPDPVVEAVGGAWWGRAILRDGYFWAGLVPDGGGFYNTARQVAPLWWADDDPRRPQILNYPSFSGSALTLSWLNSDGTPALVMRGFSNAELGQGVDQPLCAAKSTGGWRLVGQGADYFIGWIFLGAFQNRLLFALRMTAPSSGGTSLPHPTGTAPGSSPGGAPEGYCGLVEVAVDKQLFGPDGDPDLHLQLTVLESRQTALGNPTYSLSDVTAPGGGSRNRDEETEQTSALLTAWYDVEGNVRTARYSRRQLATYDYVSSAVDDRHWDLTRSTEFELLYGGSVVDQRYLSEQLAIDQVGASLSVSRTVSESGLDDDVSDWSGTYAAGASIVPEPFAVFRAGQGLVMGSVAYIFTLPGMGNVLREQDVRLLWLAAHSNNVASLCRSREPYDYPGGGDLMQVEAYSGPAIGPAGVVPGTMNRLVDRPRTSVGPFYRGFFSDAGQRWVLGTGNPVTGQVARANDYYGWPDGYPSISWV
ncbi:hypothetical protein DFO61_3363 [Ectopseudomonas oleovorans]|uniref:Uncharacterized protein n=1 Tax=Ectopseudomonas oleovorans TaxID=301 RepID=A0A397MGM9_ECTOL|nr:hypothetical protein [Pseudomonas oleovorans]RIA22673.1 hypothetical protein DFO61_3363 [Pseudomonas oleovorans]